MKQTTLCFLVNGKQVLLGMKKRGFGEGKFNGFGGKPKENESLKDAALRELLEEACVKGSKEHLEKVGALSFFFSQKPEWNQQVHVFVLKEWEGNPEETEEMAPAWFHHEKIPFDKMWQDDQHWLPRILNGKKLEAEFTFGGDNESIIKHQISEVGQLN
ncbi:MAG TPA: 8-oxo-dGTP diphosphatase [Candidatus Nanoarchaeia archaeon]|nr:8-oxo-dGTP diphosphatase [Candidatus Nanoarchaeia archaeon]